MFGSMKIPQSLFHKEGQAEGRSPFVEAARGRRPLRLCSYVVLLLCSYAAMLLYGYLALWLCGYVAG